MSVLDTARPLLNTIKRSFPTLWWRARNLAALGELYAQKWHSRDGSYDDGFWDFHETGDWEGFAAVVMSHASPRSIVDVGCGHGLTLAAFTRRDASMRLQGFEESAPAIARATARGLAVERIDLTSLTADEAMAIAGRVSSFDLTICLEVAEHLPPWHAGRLLTVLSGARTLVFSAAHPNQGGRFHVNEQPASYWIERLARRELALSARDAGFRRDVARLDLPPWYARNVHLFERASG